MEKRKMIISIGRQYGSGGSEVGAKLAERLGIGFYDKNILRLNSDESGIKESYFHLADEKAGNRLLYRVMNSLIPDQKMPSFGSDLVSADNLFRFQSEVLRKLAREESFVIMGRCAGYVLAGTEGLIRIFLYGDEDARIARIVEKGLCTEEEAPRRVKRMDRERRDYHRYYTGQDWTDFRNYDLMLDTSKLGVDKTAELIYQYIKIHGYGEET